MKEERNTKADKIVFGALKALAGWVALNPDKAFDALDKAIHLPIAKKGSTTEEQIHVLDAKTTHLGAAVLELEEKTNAEIEQLRKALNTMRKALIGMGIILGIAIIGIITLAIL